MRVSLRRFLSRRTTYKWGGSKPDPMSFMADSSDGRIVPTRSVLESYSCPSSMHLSVHAQTIWRRNHLWNPCALIRMLINTMVTRTVPEGDSSSRNSYNRLVKKKFFFLIRPKSERVQLISIAKLAQLNPVSSTIVVVDRSCCPPAYGGLIYTRVRCSYVK